MINLKSVSKKFRLEKTKKGALDFALNIFSLVNMKDFWALKDISFSLKNKEVLGIVGKNGSGKSTLLKIIAGILKPTSGDLVTEGEVVYLSGFSNGMNKNLSMKDNIYIMGVLNSLTKEEISNRIKDIIEFSELEEFLNTPLYKFSTGMIARLSFSATLFTLPESPDILLLDETFAGGIDESFREKSLNKIKSYMESAKVVIIVSHNLNYISQNCSKVLWIKDGGVQMIGDTEKVIKEYCESVK